MTSIQKETTSAHLGMLLWAVIVGLSFPVVGFITEGLPPLLLTALRFLLAGAAILPMLLRQREALPDLRALSFYGVLGLCLACFFGAMFWAADHSSALSMSVLYISVPLLAYGLGLLLRVETPALALPALLALGALGGLFMAFAEASQDLHKGFLGLAFGKGEAVFFAGCLGSALYPVLSKWGLLRGWISSSALQRTFWSLIMGTLLIALLGVLLERPSRLLAMQPLDWLLVAYLGVVSSGLTFWLLQRAAAALTPSTATAYTYLTPFVSLLLLLISEPARFTWHWLPGALLVLVATALLMARETLPRPARPAPAKTD
ncbi:MAG TPA: DMT family transporter [Kiloniellales bacterium]|nr:DMT family transporter [Kiloniellales bacterium]